MLWIEFLFRRVLRYFKVFVKKKHRVFLAHPNIYNLWFRSKLMFCLFKKLKLNAASKSLSSFKIFFFADLENKKRIQIPKYSSF